MACSSVGVISYILLDQPGYVNKILVVVEVRGQLLDGGVVI